MSQLISVLHRVPVDLGDVVLFATSPDGDEALHPAVSLPTERWEDLDSPDVITILIEGGPA